MVTDYVNNPLAGVNVSFEMGGPLGGTIEHASVVTNDSGIASPGVWTLGTAIGVYTLTAHVDGVASTPMMSAHVYEPLVASTIAAGASVTCANALSGITYCWGDAQAFPTRVPGDARFVSLTVGTGYACGLTAAGAAFCWGRDITSADAEPGSAILSVPRRIGGDSLFRLISAGETAACGLSMDGRAYCWGENTYGQLGNGTTDGSAVPTSVAGDHTFTTLATGVSHACGATAEGETYCWGRDDARQLGDPSSETCDFVDYDYYYAPVLTHVSCSKVPRRVSAAPSLASVAAGEGTCGLSRDGQAFCWGHSHDVDLVSSTLRFATITTARQIAIKSPPSTTFAFSSMCGTTASGAVYCYDEDAGLVQVASSLAFSTVVSGNTHQCGIQRDSGIAFCWGSNSLGQLGNGTLVTSNVPTPVVAP
jgi:alpha-tubulin suppressor-like RCC1 family protein